MWTLGKPPWRKPARLLQRAMKNSQPVYVVYNPPMDGIPYLAVVLAPDGTAIATRFDTAEEASAFNNQTAMRLHGDGIRQ